MDKFYISKDTIYKVYIEDIRLIKKDRWKLVYYLLSFQFALTGLVLILNDLITDSIHMNILLFVIVIVSLISVCEGLSLMSILERDLEKNRMAKDKLMNKSRYSFTEYHDIDKKYENLFRFTIIVSFIAVVMVVSSIMYYSDFN